MFYKQQYVHIYLYFTSTNICTKIYQRVKTYFTKKFLNKMVRVHNLELVYLLLIS